MSTITYATMIRYTDGVVTVIDNSDDDQRRAEAECINALPYDVIITPTHGWEPHNAIILVATNGLSGELTAHYLVTLEG